MVTAMQCRHCWLIMVGVAEMTPLVRKTRLYSAKPGPTRGLTAQWYCRAEASPSDGQVAAAASNDTQFLLHWVSTQTESVHPKGNESWTPLVAQQQWSLLNSIVVPNLWFRYHQYKVHQALIIEP